MKHAYVCKNIVLLRTGMVKKTKTGYLKKGNMWYSFTHTQCMKYKNFSNCSEKCAEMRFVMDNTVNKKLNSGVSSKGRELAIDAVFIALTYVFTAFVNIKLPIAANGGLIHLGNIPLFVAAIVFGWKTGMIAGGIGMALFDMLSGFWATWAPFTLIIAGLMGFTVGKITEKKQSYVRNVVAILAAMIIKIVGYYIAEGIIYGNFIAPAKSIPGNIVQVGVAAIIVLPISVRLKKAADKIFS